MRTFGTVHGVVGGALSVAQGGSFMQGFAGSAIGAGASVVSSAVSMGNMMLDTAIVAAAGCAGAVFSGGKCANGAVTAAFANMYNNWLGRTAGGFAGAYAGGAAGAAAGGACAAATLGACTPAIPAFTLGGSALGRFFGAALGSWAGNLVYSDDGPKDVIIDSDKYPEAAQHISDAQADGHPSEVTIERDGARQRRREATSKYPTGPDTDRDEYPPASTAEGGSGSSVRNIGRGDNRGAGGSYGGQIRGYPNGTKIRIRVK